MDSSGQGGCTPGEDAVHDYITETQASPSTWLGGAHGQLKLASEQNLIRWQSNWVEDGGHWASTVAPGYNHRFNYREMCGYSELWLYPV